MKYETESLLLAKRRETASLVMQHLMQVGKWSDIYKFLIKNGYCPVNDDQDEQKNKRVLVDLDTSIMALLIYLNYSLNKEGHTIGSLAKAMDGSDYNARKARERKIMRTLQTIAGYEVIDFYRDSHKGERNCIRIEATNLLIDFVENHLFKKL